MSEEIDDKVTIAIHCNGKPDESMLQVKVGTEALSDYISRALTLLEIAKQDLLKRYAMCVRKV